MASRLAFLPTRGLLHVCETNYPLCAFWYGIMQLPRICVPKKVKTVPRLGDLWCETYGCEKSGDAMRLGEALPTAALGLVPSAQKWFVPVAAMYCVVCDALCVLCKLSAVARFCGPFVVSLYLCAKIVFLLPKCKCMRLAMVSLCIWFSCSSFYIPVGLPCVCIFSRLLS